MAPFAYGMELDDSKLPKCFSISGKTFPLPLSQSDSGKVKSVSNKLGELAAWEAHSSLISFPENGEFLGPTLQQLVEAAVPHFHGFSDLINVQARFQKLTIYGPGMRFNIDLCKRDHATRFGTMILQLPTMLHPEGGWLCIRGFAQAVKFMEQPSFYMAAFLDDSQCELGEVMYGDRVWLVFSLERFSIGPGVDFRHHNLLACMAGVESSVGSWLAGVEREDPSFPSKVVLLLQGPYSSETRISSLLEMDHQDVFLIETLAALAEQQAGSFQLYLSKLSKMRDTFLIKQGSWMVFPEGARPWVVLPGDAQQSEVEFDHPMLVELHSEVWMMGRDQVFDQQIDEDSAECLVIILVPKKRSLYLACHRDLSGALDVAKDGSGMKQVFTFLHESKGTDLQLEPVFEARLLSQCLGLSYEHLIGGVEKLGGIRSICSADVLLQAIFRHGWSEALGAALVLGAMENREPLAYLAVKLKGRGETEAASAVIDKLNLGDVYLQESLDSLLDSLATTGDLQGVGMRQLELTGLGEDADRLHHTLMLMIEERVHRLKAEKSPGYWCQLRASFPENKMVEAFLRGPEQKLELKGFQNQAKVREFVREQFNGFEGLHNKEQHFSARAITGEGTGTNACCVITKTREACDLLEPGFQLRLLHQLRSFMLKQEQGMVDPGELLMLYLRDKKQRLW